MDIKNKFLELTKKTYPNPEEIGVLEYLPNDLKEDGFGNYYKVIDGDEHTMFTSHLDTADFSQSDVEHVFFESDNGDLYVETDGTTILGADDKAGVTIMLNMIEKEVPGIYYFFIGEESGMIGSGRVKKEIFSNKFENLEHIKNVENCISFDRRYYNSIITRQMGRDCCKDDFAERLIEGYSEVGLSMKKDSRGIYTDSASFMDIFPNCTNISVGYSNEHSYREKQNLTFLEKIANASCEVNWKKI